MGRMWYLWEVISSISWLSPEYPSVSILINMFTLRKPKINQSSNNIFTNRLLTIINTYKTGSTFFKEPWSSIPSPPPSFCIISSVKMTTFHLLQRWSCTRAACGGPVLQQQNTRNRGGSPTPSSALKIMEKEGIPCNWLSPGRSRGRKLSSPEAPCWINGQSQQAPS